MSTLWGGRGRGCSVFIRFMKSAVSGLLKTLPTETSNEYIIYLDLLPNMPAFPLHSKIMTHCFLTSDFNSSLAFHTPNCWLINHHFKHCILRMRVIWNIQKILFDHSLIPYNISAYCHKVRNVIKLYSFNWVVLCHRS